MNWIPTKIKDVPPDENILVSSHEAVYLMAHKNLVQLSGTPKHLKDVDFVAWMPLPKAFTEEDQILWEMNHSMLNSMLEGFKKSVRIDEPK